MKIGDYVRTDYGIGKIIEILQPTDVDEPDLKLDVSNCNDYPYIFKSEVMKSSPNIIELIEVGDVITTNNLCGEVTKIDGNKIYTTCYDGEYCGVEDIKSIVTKKQFESMEYKL